MTTDKNNSCHPGATRRALSRAPRGNTPVAKQSGWVSAKRELPSVSTDRRSLPKAVARVVPQGPVRGARKKLFWLFPEENIGKK